MLWYKRAKIAFNGLLRDFSSKITHDNNPMEESTCKDRRWFVIAKHKVHHSRSGVYLMNWLKKSRNKFIVYLIGTQVHHFRSGGYTMNWLKNPRTNFIVCVIGTGIVTTICFGGVETVPYTNREHVVIKSKLIERLIGETVFAKLKSDSKEKVLPEKEPQSVRVGLIAREIIESLQKEMKKDDTLKAWNNESITRRTMSVQVEGGRNKCATGHLEGINWEVVVVDESKNVNACCLPGGKIVVYTGLLKHFQSDAEIATVLGHEVGHVLARHGMENLARDLWIFIVYFLLLQILELIMDWESTGNCTSFIVQKITGLFLRLPFSRRMEMEADHIGLMLLAAAGYDPRLAPGVYEKLGKIKGKKSGEEEIEIDCFSTHPSVKKRVQSLAQYDVMMEALAIYMEFQAERRAKLDSLCEEKNSS